MLAIIAALPVLATFVEQTPETAVEKSIVIGEPVEVKETCPITPFIPTTITNSASRFLNVLPSELLVAKGIKILKSSLFFIFLIELVTYWIIKLIVGTNLVLVTEFSIKNRLVNYY